jgi:cyclopropane-fatty-acyl-phospholipid synthase
MHADFLSRAWQPNSAAAGRRAFEHRFRDWLADAGITLNGSRPWDPQIIRARALLRCAHGTLEAGRAYADCDWECTALDEFAARLVRTRRPSEVFPRWRRLLRLANHIGNPQGRRRARDAVRHYEGRFELFEAMLGPTLTYSCGYWEKARTLDDAQTAKHDLVCRKLGIEPGMRILDVGCGWGALAEHAARHYGAVVTGVTLADEQAAIARTRNSGLPVTILARDYREVEGRFDRVVSLGMFEHVGPRNYRTFFRKLSGWLAPGGLALLHSIGGLTSTTTTDPWLNEFIFPGSVLPSEAQIARASEGLFVLEDWHNFGAYYDRTLSAWNENVSRAWTGELSDYPETFQRTWRYYLLTCAGLFRARVAQLWQLVLSPQGVPGGYRRPC